jgi:hypothetical protein
MALMSVAKFLEKVRETEKSMSDYYCRINNATKKEGVRLLTDYLCRHRNRLEEAMSELDDATAGHLNKIMLKCPVDFAWIDRNTRFKTGATEIDGRDLLDIAVQFDTGLIGMYRQVSELPLIEEALAFFNSLIKIEEKDIVMLKKITATNYY